MADMRSLNAAGFQSLDGMIARIRAIPGIAADAAPDVARAVGSLLEARALAGISPDGTPWPRRVRDGGRALVNAAKAITVRAIGTVVLVVLTGPEVFHHYGAGDAPVRKIIPDGSLPRELGNAVRLAVVTGWNRTVSKTYGGSGSSRRRTK